MIETISGKPHLICDICGEEPDEEFYDYDDAVDYKITNAWRTKKQYGEWFDICPECQE